MTFGRLTAPLMALALLASAALLLLVTQLAAARVESQIRLEAEQSAGLLAALLASEIEHYQALPVALATDAEVAEVLATADSATAQKLSRRLETLSSDIGSAAVYLVAANGNTLAASNARTPASFVGHNYRFRHYFRDAMENGRGNQFALGSTTRRPGLYLSQRVDRGSRALGVLVVKVEFETLESDWLRSGISAFVTDARGAIIITTDARWRFRSETQVLRTDRADRVKLSGRSDARSFVRGHAQTIVPGWSVHSLLPVDARIGDAVTAAAAMTALALLAVGGLIVWLWQIRRRSQARQRAEEQARRILEDRVEQRTVELKDANTQLLAEMNERRRAEESARVLHEELEQANRLATLGQIAAGVTHEINQPVAAIRATADNAGTMLARGQTGPARSAMAKIAKLTERIGSITGELRAFSAKPGNRPRLISVDAAIDGALVLVGTGLRQGGVTLERSPRNSDLKLWADKIRIEQILVNLLRNAIEATEGQDKPHIAIDVLDRADNIDIRVTDNGPGVPEEVAGHLFTPFRTTKPQGLGLGLVISRDIAASIGGELTLLRPAAGDAAASPRTVFQLLLPRAS